MKKYSDYNKIGKYNKNSLNNTIKKNYMLALQNNNFVKLVNRLDISEDALVKYTSKLENTIEELENCKNCKGLSYCKNKICGYINYPYVQEQGLIFEYTPCKYEKENMKIKTSTTYFEMPQFFRDAKMSDIYIEKERLPLVKYMNEFIKKFNTNQKMKGLYLSGSFGSGKSYLLSALINELSSLGTRNIILYYPNLLKSLKASFNTENFDLKLEEIMTSDILLLDDIGAENNTSWSRDEILGTILQYRMDNNLATFFSSNLTLEELEIHLKITSNSSDAVKSRRIIERIKQLTNEMSLISENKRK